MAPCGCLGFLTLWWSLGTWMFTCQMDSPQRVFPETGRESWLKLRTNSNTSVVFWVKMLTEPPRLADRGIRCRLSGKQVNEYYCSLIYIWRSLERELSKARQIAKVILTGVPLPKELSTGHYGNPQPSLFLVPKHSKSGCHVCWLRSHS